MSAAIDTYLSPEHGWTCFHCGETFHAPGLARIHFGASPDAKPGCVARVPRGRESGLLWELRRAELERDLARVRLNAVRLGADEADCVARFHAQRGTPAYVIRDLENQEARPAHQGEPKE